MIYGNKCLSTHFFLLLIMKKFKCNAHSITVLIPSTDDEFLLGKYHQDVEKCHNHHEKFPDCVFSEFEES